MGCDKNITAHFLLHLYFYLDVILPTVILISFIICAINRIVKGITIENITKGLLKSTPTSIKYPIPIIQNKM